MAIQKHIDNKTKMMTVRGLARKYNIEIAEDAEFATEEQIAAINAAMDAQAAAEAQAAADAKAAKENPTPAPKAEETGESEQAPKKTGKTLADYGYEEGEIVLCLGRIVSGKLILKDRLIKLNGASKSDGLISGNLLHPKTKEPQKSEITMPVQYITKYTAPVEAPAAPEAASEESPAV